MNFSQKLNEYMEVLSCSAKELSQQSGISASSFSRYRNGERFLNLDLNPLRVYVKLSRAWLHKRICRS